MPVTLTSLAALGDLPFDSVIDVRSPAEYAEDHLPGAINLPALDNDERAVVGTIYKQDSPFRARKLGAALVAQNAARHLQGPLADKPGSWQPLVYCWRGGQRSGSFTSILQQIGWRADVIAGGYKSYRRLVVQAMHDVPLAHRLVLIDGGTGTAKTRLLALLAEAGAQVIDLEGAANHRGSLFGGQGAQPSQKMLESRVALALARHDPARPVFVEAESARIGDLKVPPTVWDAMKIAQRIEIGAPLAARAQYLAEAYSDVVADPARLAATLADLRVWHGAERVAAWQALARAGAFVDLAAGLVTHHYDPRYAKSTRVRADQSLCLTTLDDDCLRRAIPEILAIAG